MRIPTFILEEHNEAFYVWKKCIRQGIIKKKDNLLLHFDDHADMQVPKFNHPLTEINSRNLNEIREFVYNDLTIASFIIPAVYLGIFNEVSWIRYDLPKDETQKLYISSYFNDAKFLFLRPNNNKLTHDDRKEFIYKKIESTRINFLNKQKKDVCLDIDLDYFSCVVDPYTTNEVIINITKEEYDDFLHNKKYHSLKYLVHKLEAKEFEGKYYYIINNYNTIYPSARKVSLETINQRIKELINSLKKFQIQPKLITICRSRISGFTPEDQYEKIEKTLLNSLKEYLSLDVQKM